MLHMDGRLRDAYGLLVPLDYEELHKTYDPIHQELDSLAAHEHKKFFYSAAECLGVPASPSSLQDGQLCLQDPGSHAVVVQVLEQLLARGERHAPELWADLLRHVHNGIPSSLRPLLWPVLLRPTKAQQQQQQQQHVCWTAEQYQPLLALHKQLFAAVKSGSSTPAQHKPGQHDQHTAGTTAAAATPAQPHLQSLVAASGLPLTPQQLLEWRVGCLTWACQIEKDVHRTFPGHEWLSSPVGQACLTRLLSCFCLAAPHLGYCQGMNYVAGSMLLLLGTGITCQQQASYGSSCGGSGGISAGGSSNSSRSSSSSSSSSSAAPQPQTPLAGDSDSSSQPGSSSSALPPTSGTAAAAAAAGSRRAAPAGSMLAPGSSGGGGSGTAAAAAVSSLERLEGVVFECLLGFAERVLPGYYSPAMVAPQVDQRVLSHLAAEHLPSLTARLTALGLSPAQPAPAWLLAGFAASSMPLATVARLWDVTFFEQSGAALIRACLALLHLFSAAFDAALDCCDAGLLLQALPGLAFDSDRLLMLARDAYSEVSPDTLTALQHCFRAEVLAEIEQAAAAARKQEQQQQQHQQQQGATTTTPRAGRAAAAPPGGSNVAGSNGSSAAAVAAAAAAVVVGEAAGSSSGGGRDGGSSSVPFIAAAVNEHGGVVHGEGAGGAVQVPASGAARAVSPAAAAAAAARIPASQEAVPWVPDFDEAAAAAAAGGLAGGVAGAAGADGATAAAAAAASVPAGWGVMQQQQQQRSRIVGDEDVEGPSDIDQETGSLLGPQQQQQQQQQQCVGDGSSSSLAGHPQSGLAAGSSGGSSGVAAGSSGGSSGVALKTHSLEVSRSKAIAQALAIAAVPGLPVLPCISVTPKQQLQQQSADDSGGASSSRSRSAGLFRSLGVSRQAGSSRGAAAGLAALRVPGPRQHSWQQQNGIGGGGSGSSPGGGPFSASASAVRILSAAIDESSDFCEDVEGSGWMLLGGSSPRVAAAAAAAAAGAAADGGEDCAAAVSGGSLAATSAAAVGGCNVRVLCDSLRDSYGLAGLTVSMRELAAAVQGAGPGPSSSAGAAAAASLNAQQAGGHSGGSGGGSSNGSTGGLPGRCLALAECALAAAEQVVGDLAQQTASVGALQCQLDRSMARLEQQDDELASKDELIERLQQRLGLYEPLSSSGSGLNPNSSSSSNPQHSPHRTGAHRQQQQQQLYGGAGGFAGGGSSSGTGSADGSSSQGRHRFGLRRQQQQSVGEVAGDGGGQGFVAAALARFGSPSKGRG